MKRILTIVLVVLLVFSMLGVLTSCGKTGKCEMCGSEGRVKKVDFPILGKMDLCSDCAAEIKGLTR